MSLRLIIPANYITFMFEFVLRNFSTRFFEILSDRNSAFSHGVGGPP